MIRRLLDATLQHPRLTRDYIWGYLWGFLMTRLLFGDAPLTHIEIFTIGAFIFQVLTMIHMWWTERAKAKELAFAKTVLGYVNGPESGLQ